MPLFDDGCVTPPLIRYAIVDAFTRLMFVVMFTRLFTAAWMIAVCYAPVYAATALTLMSMARRQRRRYTPDTATPCYAMPPHALRDADGERDASEYGLFVYEMRRARAAMPVAMMLLLFTMHYAMSASVTMITRAPRHDDSIRMHASYAGYGDARHAA